VVAGIAVCGWFVIPLAFGGEPRESAFLQRLFVVALVLRLAVAVGTYHLFPYGYFAPDETGYVSSARDIINGVGVDLGSALNGQGWQYFNAALFQAVGVQPLVPRLWNSVVGAATPILVYAIARRLGARSGARWTAAIAAIFPSLVLWSSLNLKDADVWFLVLAALLLGLRLQESFESRDLLLLVLTMAVLWPLRQFADVAVALAVLAGWAWAYPPLKAIASRSVRGVKVGIPMVAGIGILGVGALALLYGDEGPRLAHLRHSLALGARSATDPDPGIATFGGALRFLPTGLRDFFTRPFPWEGGTTFFAVTRPETIIYYALFLVAVAGVVRSLRVDAARAVSILTFIAVAGAGYALVLANLGTIYRERDQLIIVMLAFVGVGVDAVRQLVSSRGGRALHQPQ